MKIVYLFLTIASLMLGCSPQITTKLSTKLSPLNYEEEVVVYGLQESFPDASETIGTVSIGESGFTVKCSLPYVIELAKLEARKAGGNAIKITEHAVPGSSGSSCHQITATILKVDPYNSGLAAFLEEEESNLPKTADYALLHVYRLRGLGHHFPFNLYLDHHLLANVKNNWKETIIIREPGPYLLWARTESDQGILIDIEMGKEYYIRCALFMGQVVGHPKIELIDNPRGKVEFASISQQN